RGRRRLNRIRRGARRQRGRDRCRLNRVCHGPRRQRGWTGGRGRGSLGRREAGFGGLRGGRVAAVAGGGVLPQRRLGGSADAGRRVVRQRVFERVRRLGRDRADPAQRLGRFDPDVIAGILQRRFDQRRDHCRERPPVDLGKLLGGGFPVPFVG